MDLWAVGQRVSYQALLSSHRIIFWIIITFWIKKNADGGEDRHIFTDDYLLILLLTHPKMKILPAPTSGEGLDSSRASAEIRFIAISPPLPGPASDMTSRIFPPRAEADPHFRELRLTANYSFCIPLSPVWRVPIHSVQMVNINGKWAASS